MHVYYCPGYITTTVSNFRKICLKEFLLPTLFFVVVVVEIHASNPLLQSSQCVCQLEHGQSLLGTYLSPMSICKKHNWIWLIAYKEWDYYNCICCKVSIFFLIANDMCPCTCITFCTIKSYDIPIVYLVVIKKEKKIYEGHLHFLPPLYVLQLQAKRLHDPTLPYTPVKTIIWLL